MARKKDTPAVQEGSGPKPAEPLDKRDKLRKILQEYMLDDDSKLDFSDPDRPRLKKAKGGRVDRFEDSGKIARPKEPLTPEELKEFKEQLKKRKEEKLKKADGGMVLKQATDDRNRTPNKTVCRGGGAAIKGIKFSGVK